MSTRSFVWLAGLALLGASGVAAAASETERVVTSLDRVVTVEDVQSTGDTVRGQLVNHTDDQLEDVRLMVSDQFLWRNERHPGSDSPSQAHAVTVPGPIPPHGSVPFEYRRPSPLPQRSDGDFTTDVAAVELTRRPPRDVAYEERVRDRYEAERDRYYEERYRRRHDDPAY
jgi:hypothetical protein